MTVTLYQCDWTEPLVNSVRTCSVSEDEMAVGGGSEVDEEGDPGLLLMRSYPTNDLRTWVAGTGTPGSDPSTPYRVRVYALGLRLGGLSGSQLRSIARHKSVSSGPTPVNRPTASVTADIDWVMVGGGAYTQGEQFLTYTYGDGDTWLAGSKDHGSSDPGFVTAVLIQLPGCPDGYVGICLNRGPHWNSGSWVSGGYGTNTDWGNLGGYVTTSIGAEASYAGDGRMLTDLFPVYFFGGFLTIARSKDHWFTDSGTTWATTYNLQQD